MVLGLSATTAVAEAKWQKPIAMACDLEPGGICNVEAVCPEDAPWVVAGGGGIPKAEPEDNAVAMTMNLAINEKTWRVRWRNLSGEDRVKGKFAVRIKCATSAEEAGW
ncbi:MAG: hypothetical protein D6754_07910 [Alphaproteobacteria bacterium]|nr:MAG: hypothetical protein D6754_07910 [Alphaproteobacteria bacterium]